jgi:hypothetical protein
VAESADARDLKTHRQPSDFLENLHFQEFCDFSYSENSRNSAVSVTPKCDERSLRPTSKATFGGCVPQAQKCDSGTRLAAKPESSQEMHPVWRPFSLTWEHFPTAIGATKARAFAPSSTDSDCNFRASTAYFGVEHLSVSSPGPRGPRDLSDLRRTLISQHDALQSSGRGRPHDCFPRGPGSRL